MSRLGKRIVQLAAAAVGLWLGVRYLLPVLLPFLLGLALALMAEPMVRLGENRLRLRRWLSAGLGVSLTLVLVIGLVSFLTGLLLRQLGTLAQALPDVQEMADQGVSLLRQRLLDLADRMPGSLGQLVSGSAEELSGGSALIRQVTQRIPGFLAGVLDFLSSGALVLGTAVIAAFLISSRLPKLRQWVSLRTPQPWKDSLKRIRTALWGWLKAQLVLLSLTYGLVTAGLWLLQVPFAPVWALFIALVDAAPILGTGTVLVPWAVVEFLRQQPWMAAGLLALYAVTLVSRTVLEPRLVGRQVGLDPLVILFAMYAGLQLLGFWGLILGPLLAAAIKAATQPPQAIS